MKIFVGTAFALSIVLLVSCQKELNIQVDPSTTNPGGGSGGGGSTGQTGLLAKIVTKANPNDSVVLYFTYTSTGKLNSVRQEDPPSASFADYEERYVRNSAGMIT